jgi:two-component system alkaline phosphatase synthesis response regulator PhoP
MTQKILVVEDEVMLARLLSYNLQQQGYEVTVCDNGNDGLKAALSNDYSMILLDVMLPGLTGFEVLREVRKASIRTPVIILTARNAEEEIVQGLNEGADDYITKPFGVAELLARLAAIFRRTLQSNEKYANVVPSIDKTISIGNLVLYPERYVVKLKGVTLQLRPKEFELLQYFMIRPGIVVARNELMDEVWGYDYIGGQRTVDVHVSSLRKKMEAVQPWPRIEPVHGIGYKLILEP